MTRFIEGRDRDQATLFPERLDDAIDADNPVRVVDAFIDALDLTELGFDVLPEPTGRPGYHPATLLKLYLYGYLNQIQSSRRLERECRRNIELMWLVGQLTPDFKTIADFRKDNGPAIREVCSPVRCLVPRHASAGRAARRDRRQQVQGGEQPREELHARSTEEAHGDDRAGHHALSRPISIVRIARPRRPASRCPPAKSQRLDTAASRPSEAKHADAVGSGGEARRVG